MRGKCENGFCSEFGNVRLFIDDLGYEGRFCPSCYKKRTKELYGDEEEQKEKKIKFKKGVDFDFCELDGKELEEWSVK